MRTAHGQALPAFERVFMGQDGVVHKMAAAIGVEALWRHEARRAILWLPVFLGAGIWLYFALPREPDPRLAALAALPSLALLPPRIRAAGLPVLAPLLALLAFGLGFALALAATHRADPIPLGWPIYAPAQGRVVALTRANSGAPRVLLDRVSIERLPPHRTPRRVRVTLLAETRETAPRPGERIRVTARLSPPGGPVEPGAFDFRLPAHFDGLGAVGYARVAVTRLGPAPADGPMDGVALRLARARLALADALMAAMPGPAGAFAAAIVVGDRAGIEEADAEALRAANLAHLLAISGLHMGILTGLVFALVRMMLAGAAPRLAGIAARRIAALAALGAGAAYLALSGATVATQRAFVMVGVALTAVLLGRLAITLRGLALAAAIVLAIRPVSLLEAGFQMSFAATAALVAGYEELRRLRGTRAPAAPTHGWRLLRRGAVYAAGVVFTSVIAGAATAPFAAYHFNRVAPWGLLANLAAVPVMGLVVAPAAMAAALLAPFGLEAVPLAVMAAGIEWILDVAHFVAALPGASRTVPAAPPAVLALVVLGGLWLVLWRGPWRLAGLPAIAAALVIWSHPPPRPDVLVAPEGRLVGVLGPQGRAIDHPRAQSYAAETWLRRDGDDATQAEAAERPPLRRGRGWSSAALSAGWRLEAIHSRKVDRARVAALCRPRTILIVRSGSELDGPCLYFGRTELRRLGSIAIWIGGDGPRLRVASDPARWRLWHGRRHDVATPAIHRTGEGPLAASTRAQAGGPRTGAARVPGAGVGTGREAAGRRPRGRDGRLQ